jgi:nucleotide-binding universal stress UspA family protein
MKRIVVGIDGSEPSRQALEWAAAEARLRQAELEIVLVWEFPLVNYHGFSTVARPEDLEEAARETLARAARSVTTDDLVVTPALVEGMPAPVLLERAEGAELLVVGSRGHGGFTGLLLGSVSMHCVTHAPCTVAVVRPS